MNFFSVSTSSSFCPSHPPQFFGNLERKLWTINIRQTFSLIVSMISATMWETINLLLRRYSHHSHTFYLSSPLTMNAFSPWYLFLYLLLRIWKITCGKREKSLMLVSEVSRAVGSSSRSPYSESVSGRIINDFCVFYFLVFQQMRTSRIGMRGEFFYLSSTIALYESLKH